MIDLMSLKTIQSFSSNKAQSPYRTIPSDILITYFQKAK